MSQPLFQIFFPLFSPYNFGKYHCFTELIKLDSNPKQRVKMKIKNSINIIQVSSSGEYRNLANIYVGVILRK